jgi:hypothetical protein
MGPYAAVRQIMRTPFPAGGAAAGVWNCASARKLSIPASPRRSGRKIPRGAAYRFSRAITFPCAWSLHFILMIKVCTILHTDVLRRIAGKIVLGQIRPVDGGRVVVAQHDDASLVLLAPQFRGCGKAGRSTADDHDPSRAVQPPVRRCSAFSEPAPPFWLSRKACRRAVRLPSTGPGSRPGGATLPPCAG